MMMRCRPPASGRLLQPAEPIPRSATSPVVRVYLDATGGTTYHYRDSNGLEVDIIVELDDGRWGAIEVKLGENRIEEGAESLAQFARTVNLRSAGQPSFLAVLTGANVYPTRRPDGIDVIPIAALGP
jgi:hypothetical protein